MKSPKQQFLENAEDVRFLSDLTEKAAFQRAINYALLQLVYESNSGYGLGEMQADRAAMRYASVQGVQEYIRILNTLWQQPKPQTRIDTGNLIHK